MIAQGRTAQLQMRRGNKPTLDAAPGAGSTLGHVVRSALHHRKMCTQSRYLIWAPGIKANNLVEPANISFPLSDIKRSSLNRYLIPMKPTALFVPKSQLQVIIRHILHRQDLLHPQTLQPPYPQRHLLQSGHRPRAIESIP